jgi:transposase
MAEVGIIARKGAAGFAALLAMLAHDGDDPVPAAIRPILAPLAAQWRAADEQIETLDRQILAWHRSNAESLRLATIPQIGPIVASALIATVGDATRFRSSRQFAAWIGLVPAQNSTGGKERLGAITKTGDRYLRQLLVVAATGMIRPCAPSRPSRPGSPSCSRADRPKKAAVALANKLARIAWALLVRAETYRTPAATVAA